MKDGGMQCFIKMNKKKSVKCRVFSAWPERSIRAISGPDFSLQTKH